MIIPCIIWTSGYINEPRSSFDGKEQKIRVHKRIQFKYCHVKIYFNDSVDFFKIAVRRCNDN